MGNCWSLPSPSAAPPNSNTGSNKELENQSQSFGGSSSNNYTTTSSNITNYTTRFNSSTSLWDSENSNSNSNKNWQSSGVRRDGEGQILDASNLRVFTLAELKAATQNFRADTVIGEGGFGRVYKGLIKERNKRDRFTVAVKKLNPHSLQGVEQWQTEVNFLGRLSHPNLIKLFGFGRDDGELFLVYEFMQRGSLDNHLFGRGANVRPLSWDTRLKVTIGAARALAFLHSQEKKIICRDFKASNILLDKTYAVKLSDFGLAKYGPTADHSHVSTQVIGTQGHAAPEYIATGHLYVKSDVYGFGILLMEILTGKRIMDIRKHFCQEKPLIDWLKLNLLNRVKMRSTMDAKLEGRYPSNLALQLAQLTLKCIQDDPKVRPSMKEVVETLEKIEAANEKPADKKNRAILSRVVQQQDLPDGG
ncbi:probable serine/threonine-protein kinase PIX13 isoform X2 [Abrus precatorius]|uniref:non-specific serine/threonine protein kinase n=1 Tax=Abrus precatorius TaxID=3816 RepID=A0A8B8JDR2_ABRPR|nr:probable serine/threonine-protein kinase PIX13 isoform X2 [Abrus precatorius]